MPKIDLTSPIPAEPGVCRSCGTTLNGDYCNVCGEKAYVPGEHSVRHFLGDVLNAITFVDGKFIRTLKLMFRQPGVMSYLYVSGRRVPFIKPMSMFFIVNLIYFMFPMSDGFNSTLYTQMHNLPYSNIATNMVQTRMKKEKKDLKTFTIEYETQSTNMAKMFLVLLVIYFSLPLWLINIRKGFSYFDHLTVSLELMSITILLSFISLVWLVYAISKITGIAVLMTDAYISWPSMLISFGLFFLAERNTYRQNMFRSIAKAALLLFFFVVCLQLYRGSLFFITMWTL
jgi:hypothetical protein